MSRKQIINNLTHALVDCRMNAAASLAIGAAITYLRDPVVAVLVYLVLKQP